MSQSISKAVKRMCCPRCSTNYFEHKLDMYRLPCGHSVCRNCSFEKCELDNKKTLDNQQNIDFAVIELLKHSDDIDLDEN